MSRSRTRRGGMIRTFLWCAGLLLLSAASAHAQATASISGTVADESGAVLPGATITVKNLEMGSTRLVATDSAGAYRVLSLAVGRYEVRTDLMGFTSEVKSVTLTIGQEAVVTFALKVGGVTEDVIVTAEASLINTTTTSTSGLVGEREVKDLPLNGRSIDNLITLNPGAVSVSSLKGGGGITGLGNTFAIAGRRPTENLFLLNGIEYTGESAIGVTPGGVSGQLLGIDAIREFNVVSDAYSAEYGKRAGGQINIVTASGTNSFHGSVFEFARNSRFDARNFFDKGGVPLFNRNNFGAAGGGPIRKNTLFVFGNYEGFRQNLGVSSFAIVPDMNVRQGLLPDPRTGQLVNVGLAPGVAPYFALWPEPNGRVFGDGTAEAFANPKQHIREDFFTVRIDNRWSDLDTLSFVYTFDDGQNTAPLLSNPLTADYIVSRNQVMSLEETHVFSQHVINSLRLGVSRAQFTFDERASVDLPANLSFVSGRPVGQVKIGGGAAAGASSLSIGGSGVTTDARIARTIYTIADSLQIVKSKHLIAVGIHAEALQVSDDGAFGKYGQWTFANLNDFMQGRSTVFAAVPSGTVLNWRQFEGAWFVQDTIKLTSALTVNAGLRHEFTNGWNERDARAANYVQGPTGALLTDPRVGDSVFTVNNAKNLFAPRAGAAWDPTGKGKTSLRAGVGIFYTLLDDIGFCCDTNPPFNTRISIAGQRFPFQVTPGVPLPAAAVAPAGIQPDIRTPRVVRWNVRFEQELMPALALRVGYDGSHAENQTVVADLNTATPTIRADGTKFFPPGTPRRNSVLANGRFFIDAGVADYRALEVELIRRLSQGTSIRANYTFSRSLDNGSQVVSNHSLNSPQNLLDPDDPGRDRGPSSFDVGQRFSLNGSYELPFGRDAQGAVGALAGGWQLNGIVTLQTGLPFTPILGFNQSRNGDLRSPDRPDVKPGASLDDAILGTPQRWFDPTVFTLPAAGTYGNAGRNSLRTPGIRTVDASVFKSLRFGRGVGAQIRIEAFNILNRANFGLPNPVVLTSTGAIPASAGVITATSTSARQIQFGLKLVW